MPVLPAALPCVALFLCLIAIPRTAPGMPAGVREAVRSVWAHHPDVDAARANVDAARARARAAGMPVYNPELAVATENADTQRRTIGIAMPLDAFGKRDARASEGEANLRAAEAAYAQVRRDTALGWLKAWTAARFATQQRQLGERRLHLMERFDTLAARQLAVGDVGPPERDLASLALAQARVEQAVIVADEATAQAGLAAFGAVTDGTAAQWSDTEPLPLPTEGDDRLDALPELRQARARIDVADAARQVARRERRPDPTLSLTAGRVRDGRRNDSVIGLNLSIPLPVRNNGMALVDAAQADANAAAAQARALSLRAAARARETWQRYQAMRSAVQAVSDSRAAAFEERALVLERLWQSGEVSTADFLLQLKQSVDTGLAVANLRGQAWQAWFDYLGACGRLMPWLGDTVEDAR
jgi:outer membrane protein, heavy metal efflux system